jgi:uncharacterized protein HemX
VPSVQPESKTQPPTKEPPGPGPEPGSPTTGEESSSTKSNKGTTIGIAVGVVAGVLAIGVGVFMFIRWRRGKARQEEREDYLEKDEGLVEEAQDLGYEGDEAEMPDVDGDIQLAFNDGGDFGFD